MTPTNRLETFLAMIAGDETVTPIKPITNVEKYLNLIAMKRKETGGKGNPWEPETSASGIEARLVIGDLQLEETPAYSMYMLDLDLGINEFQYDASNVYFTIEGEKYGCGRIWNAGISSDPLSPQVSSTGAPDKYVLADASSIKPDDFGLEPELSNLPGVFIGLVCAYFYRGDKTIHAQMFFLLSDDPKNQVVYDDTDAVRINVSYDHCTEYEEHTNT